MSITPKTDAIFIRIIDPCEETCRLRVLAETMESQCARLRTELKNFVEMHEGYAINVSRRRLHVRRLLAEIA